MVPSPTPKSSERSREARQRAARELEALLVAAQTGALAAGTTAPPAVAGTGSAATAGALLSGIGAGAIASAVAAMVAAYALSREGDDWLAAVMRAEFGDDLDEGDLRRQMRLEADFEDDYLRAMRGRLERDLSTALREPDPRSAMDAVIEREERYAMLHDDATAARVQAALRREIVRRDSPEGALWVLDPTVKEHTPDCVAIAAVGWWPWEALDRLHPPVHTGCRCELYSADEAVGLGLVPDGWSIPSVDPAEALARMEGFIESFEIDVREALEHPPEPPTWDPLDLSEVRWDRRYAKGTVWGGRFMPRRGGFAPRITIRDVLRFIGDSDVPNISSRGGDPPPVRVAQGARSVPTRRARPARERRGGAEAVEGLIQGLEGYSRQVAAHYGASTDIRSIGSVSSGPNGSLVDDLGQFDARDLEGMGLRGISGFRNWAGDIRLGVEGADALATLASGETLDEVSLGEGYAAYRVLAHEMSHAQSKMLKSKAGQDAYKGRGSIGYALEEALVEEAAHDTAVEMLKREGRTDVLRWLARNEDHPYAAGVYQPQRAALSAILDDARVPLGERRELMRRMLYEMDHEERLDELGRLLAQGQGLDEAVARSEVESLLRRFAGEEWVQRAGVDFGAIRVAPVDNPFREESAGVSPGDTVTVTTPEGTRISGRAAAVARTPDGPAVAIDLPDGTRRFSTDFEVDERRPQDGANGASVGDRVEVVDVSGARYSGTLESARQDALGFAGVVRTADGPIQVSSESVRLLRREGAGEGDEAAEPEAAGATRSVDAVDAVREADEVIDVGGDVTRAADLLAEGRRVRLSQPREVSLLLDELRDRVETAKRLGEQAPDFDLCGVTVRDTNLFCVESKGIPRVQMPQLKGVPVAGSIADGMEKNDKGEADLSEEFLRHLTDDLGVDVTEEEELVSHLRVTQRELNGAKVAGMVGALQNGVSLGDDAVFISRDGYIVDGHHRVVANIGLDLGDGKLGDVSMRVRRVDMDIIDLLEESNEFAVANGIPQAGFNGPGDGTASVSQALISTATEALQVTGEIGQWHAPKEWSYPGAAVTFAYDATFEASFPGDLKEVMEIGWRQIRIGVKLHLEANKRRLRGARARLGTRRTPIVDYSPRGRFAQGGTASVGMDPDPPEIDWPPVEAPDPGVVSAREAMDEPSRRDTETLLDRLARDRAGHDFDVLTGLHAQEGLRPPESVRDALRRGERVSLYAAVPADGQLLPGAVVSPSEAYARSVGGEDARVESVEADLAEMVTRGDPQEFLWYPRDAEDALRQVVAQATPDRPLPPSLEEAAERRGLIAGVAKRAEASRLRRIADEEGVAAPDALMAAVRALEAEAWNDASAIARTLEPGSPVRYHDGDRGLRRATLVSVDGQRATLTDGSTRRTVGIGDVVGSPRLSPTTTEREIASGDPAVAQAEGRAALLAERADLDASVGRERRSVVEGTMSPSVEEARAELADWPDAAEDGGRLQRDDGRLIPGFEYYGQGGCVALALGLRDRYPHLRVAVLWYNMGSPTRPEAGIAHAVAYDPDTGEAYDAAGRHASYRDALGNYSDQYDITTIEDVEAWSRDTMPTLDAAIAQVREWEETEEYVPDPWVAVLDEVRDSGLDSGEADVIESLLDDDGTLGSDDLGLSALAAHMGMGRYNPENPLETDAIYDAMGDFDMFRAAFKVDRGGELDDYERELWGGDEARLVETVLATGGSASVAAQAEAGVAPYDRDLEALSGGDERSRDGRRERVKRALDRVTAAAGPLTNADGEPVDVTADFGQPGHIPMGEPGQRSGPIEQSYDGVRVTIDFPGPDATDHERQVHEWRRSVDAAIARGDLDERDARLAGWQSVLPPFGDRRYSPAPEGPLYHVTTAVRAVERDGLRTRAERGLSGDEGASGLGGNSLEGISLTSDADSASRIARDLRGHVAVLRGEMTADEWLDYSGVGAIARTTNDSATLTRLTEATDEFRRLFETENAGGSPEARLGLLHRTMSDLRKERQMADPSQPDAWIVSRPEELVKVDPSEVATLRVSLPPGARVRLGEDFNDEVIVPTGDLLTVEGTASPSADPRVGESFDGAEGDSLFTARIVDRRVIDGNDRYLIEMIGTRGTGENAREISETRAVAPDQLDSEIEFWTASRPELEASARRDEEAAGERSRLAKQQEIADSFDGFVDGMTPRSRKRAQDALRRNIRHDGSMTTREALIRSLVDSGWVVGDAGESWNGSTRVKAQRRITSPDGRAFFTESDLTKTALDFAEYLTGLRNGTPSVPSAPPRSGPDRRRAATADAVVDDRPTPSVVMPRGTGGSHTTVEREAMDHLTADPTAVLDYLSEGTASRVALPSGEMGVRQLVFHLDRATERMPLPSTTLRASIPDPGDGRATIRGFTVARPDGDGMTIRVAAGTPAARADDGTVILGRDLGYRVTARDATGRPTEAEVGGTASPAPSPSVDPRWLAEQESSLAEAREELKAARAELRRVKALKRPPEFAIEDAEDDVDRAKYRVDVLRRRIEVEIAGGRGDEPIDPNNVWYHGTDPDLASDIKADGLNVGMDGTVGGGVYLAATWEEAREYGDAVFRVDATDLDADYDESSGWSGALIARQTVPPWRLSRVTGDPVKKARKTGEVEGLSSEEIDQLGTASVAAARWSGTPSPRSETPEEQRRRQLAFLEARLDETPELRPLAERLVGIGGEAFVPPSGGEEDLDKIMERGEAVDGSDAQFVVGQRSRCHGNTACLWRDGRAGIATGYALSDDGLWRQHTWGVEPDGTILETTEPREKYYGFRLTDEEAEEFAFANPDGYVEPGTASVASAVLDTASEVLGWTGQAGQWGDRSTPEATVAATLWDWSFTESFHETAATMSGWSKAAVKAGAAMTARDLGLDRVARRLAPPAPTMGTASPDPDVPGLRGLAPESKREVLRASLDLPDSDRSMFDPTVAAAARSMPVADVERIAGRDAAVASIGTASPEADYRGQHRAADASSGAPLHEVTGYYPEDVYGPDGARLYGANEAGEGEDEKVVSLLRKARGKPDTMVTVYRAVPASRARRIERIREAMFQHQRRGTHPEVPGIAEGDDWYDRASDELERLERAEADSPSGGREINPGDWVTPSRRYAVEHGEGNLPAGEDYEIVSKRVPARHLFTQADSLMEWGYDPNPEAAGSRSPEPTVDVASADQIAREIDEGMGEITVRVGGREVGSLRFSLDESFAHIDMVEVEGEYRRRGIATALLAEMRRRFPREDGWLIDAGETTPEGGALVRSNDLVDIHGHDISPAEITDSQMAEAYKRMREMGYEGYGTPSPMMRSEGPRVRVQVRGERPATVRDTLLTPGRLDAEARAAYEDEQALAYAVALSEMVGGDVVVAGTPSDLAAGDWRAAGVVAPDGVVTDVTGSLPIDEWQTALDLPPDATVETLTPAGVYSAVRNAGFRQDIDLARTMVAAREFPATEGETRLLNGRLHRAEAVGAASVEAVPVSGPEGDPAVEVTRTEWETSAPAAGWDSPQGATPTDLAKRLEAEMPEMRVIRVIQQSTEGRSGIYLLDEAGLDEDSLADLDRFTSPFRGMRPGGMEVVVTEYWPEQGDGNTCRVHGEIRTPDGRFVGTWRREFERSGGRGPFSSVHHALLEIDEEFRGNGVGSDFVRQSEEAYQRIGVDTVTLQAAEDDGGYVWARDGFVFDEGDETGALVDPWSYTTAILDFFEAYQPLPEDGLEMDVPIRVIDEVRRGNVTVEQVADFLRRAGWELKRDYEGGPSLRRMIAVPVGEQDGSTPIPTDTRFASPAEIAEFGREASLLDQGAWDAGYGMGESWLGKVWMRGTTWDGVKKLGQGDEGGLALPPDRDAGADVPVMTGSASVEVQTERDYPRVLPRYVSEWVPDGEDLDYLLRKAEERGDVDELPVLNDSTTAARAWAKARTTLRERIKRETAEAWASLDGFHASMPNPSGGRIVFESRATEATLRTQRDDLVPRAEEVGDYDIQVRGVILARSVSDSGIESTSGIDREDPTMDEFANEAALKVGVPIAKFQRRFNPYSGIVFHDSLDVDEQWQGEGIGAAFLADSERRYADRTYDRVRVSTAEVGGYAWARLGFEDRRILDAQESGDLDEARRLVFESPFLTRYDASQGVRVGAELMNRSNVHRGGGEQDIVPGEVVVEDGERTVEYGRRTGSDAYGIPREIAERLIYDPEPERFRAQVEDFYRRLGWRLNTDVSLPEPEDMEVYDRQTRGDRFQALQNALSSLTVERMEAPDPDGFTGIREIADHPLGKAYLRGVTWRGEKRIGVDRDDGNGVPEGDGTASPEGDPAPAYAGDGWESPDGTRWEHRELVGRAIAGRMERGDTVAATDDLGRVAEQALLHEMRTNARSNPDTLYRGVKAGAPEADRLGPASWTEDRAVAEDFSAALDEYDMESLRTTGSTTSLHGCPVDGCPHSAPITGTDHDGYFVQCPLHGAGSFDPYAEGTVMEAPPGTATGLRLADYEDAIPDDSLDEFGWEREWVAQADVEAMGTMSPAATPLGLTVRALAEDTGPIIDEQAALGSDSEAYARRVVSSRVSQLQGSGEIDPRLDAETLTRLTLGRVRLHGSGAPPVATRLPRVADSAVEVERGQDALASVIGTMSPEAVPTERPDDYEARKAAFFDRYKEALRIDVPMGDGRSGRVTVTKAGAVGGSGQTVNAAIEPGQIDALVSAAEADPSMSGEAIMLRDLRDSIEAISYAYWREPEVIDRPMLRGQPAWADSPEGSDARSWSESGSVAAHYASQLPALAVVRGDAREPLGEEAEIGPLMMRSGGLRDEAQAREVLGIGASERLVTTLYRVPNGVGVTVVPREQREPDGSVRVSEGEHVLRPESVEGVTERLEVDVTDAVVRFFTERGAGTAIREAVNDALKGSGWVSDDLRAWGQRLDGDRPADDLESVREELSRGTASIEASVRAWKSGAREGAEAIAEEIARNGREFDQPLYRGQSEAEPAPTDGVRGWTTDLQTAVEFAFNPAGSGYSYAGTADAPPRSYVVYRATGGRGISANDYAETTFGPEDEVILDGSTVVGLERLEVPYDRTFDPTDPDGENDLRFERVVGQFQARDRGTASVLPLPETRETNAGRVVVTDSGEVPFDTWIAEVDPARYVEQPDWTDDFWAAPVPLYHGTWEDRADSIASDGLQATASGDLSRFDDLPEGAVFAHRSPEWAVEGLGYDRVVEIDTAAMKADGLTPRAEPEPEVKEETLRVMLAEEMGQSYRPSWERGDEDQDLYPGAEDTVVIYGDVPATYLRLAPRETVA